MKYDFLIGAYEAERVKVISARSMFRDGDLPVRRNASDPLGASAFASDAARRIIDVNGYITPQAAAAVTCPAACAPRLSPFVALGLVPVRGRPVVLGSKFHDARLAATMNVHGIRRILTFNTDDFARYDVEAVHLHCF